MRLNKTVYYSMGCVVVLAGIASMAQAAGVPIGSSTLIKVLDYSDSFTATEYGGLPDRDGLGGYPLSTIDSPVNGTPGEGLAVENCYGNTPQYWSDAHFSIAKDSTALSSDTVSYYGGSSAGSDTGMTQTGGWHFGDFGIPYGLRSRFVVQYDAVHSLDRMNITFGGARDWMWDPTNVAIFFRLTGNPDFPEIGIINPETPPGEINTGFTSGITYSGEWHNYAALVDMTQRTVEVFVDEVSRGVVDINTVGGGALAGVTLSNQCVNVGWYGGDRLWTDNFQIGSPDLVNPVKIPGDADGNQVVDTADAARLAENWGATTFNSNYATWWEMGDFNGDTTVNAADAAILAANWTGSTEGTAVPEPSTLVLLAAALGAVGLLRCR